MTLSDKQLEANRTNAQKSTGPRTPEGKRHSSLNAISHGCFADNIVLPGESRDTFLSLIRSLYAEFQPKTPSENMLVETMAISRWRILRLWTLESRTISHQRACDAANSFAGQNPIDATLPPSTQTALSLRNLAIPPSSLETIGRFEGRFDRQYHRAADRLQRFQSARRLNAKNEAAMLNDLNDLPLMDTVAKPITDPDQTPDEPQTECE